MPINEDTGEPDYARATPERTREYLYNEAGLEADEADAYVENNARNTQKELGKVKRMKPKMGTSLVQFRAEKAAWQQRMDEAQRNVDYWEGVKNARQREDNERRKAGSVQQDGTATAVVGGSEEEQQKAAQEAVAMRKAESVQENGTVTNGSEAGNEGSKDTGGSGRNESDGSRITDPRSMSDEERQRRGEMLRNATETDVVPNQIVSTKNKTARKAAEEWWDDNVGDEQWYETEVGEVKINRNSVESSLAHRYGQMKLDAITSLVDGFSNAVYLGTMPDSERRETQNHYFAYPINYNGQRCYVFCRTLHDNNTNRLYVHEVFVEGKIKKGNTLQTAASKPHGGIALYRDILANVLLSDGKDSENPSNSQAKGEKVAENQAAGGVQVALSAAEAETNTEPTEAQKEAGNYKKGHVRIDGYDITIENPKGSVRRGTDADGKQWSVTMNNTYGYIRGTEGVDGDHIDIFLSDDPSNGNVFVIDQVKADGTFDEHKVMYGFASAEEARDNYLANYSEGWTGLGTISEVTKEEFKKWIESSHRKTKPFAEYKNVKSITEDVDQPKYDEHGNLIEQNTDPQPIGKGMFGNIYDQFRGRLKEAFDFLIKHKSGDLLGVFHRDGFGDIDLVWGDKGGGAEHIIDKHVGDGKSFVTEEEAFTEIDRIIKTGKKVFENGDKVVFKDGNKIVTVRKNWREKGKKIADKNWVLTAYDETSADSESPVATNKSLAGSATSVSAGKGTDLFGNAQGSGNALSFGGKRASLRQQKTGSSASEVTEAERALRDELNNVLTRAGIEVVTDVEEGQRVLDEVNVRTQKKKKKRKTGIRVSKYEYAIIASQITPNSNKGAAQQIYTADNFYICTGIDSNRNFTIETKIPIEGNQDKINKLENEFRVNGTGKGNGPLAQGSRIGGKRSNRSDVTTSGRRGGNAESSQLYSGRRSESNRGDGLDRRVSEKNRQDLGQRGGRRGRRGRRGQGGLTEEEPRFFRTSNGDAYGFTLNGKVYIDPRMVNAETPIHEYSHLWSTAIREQNPKEWKNIVELMKGTAVWDEVVRTYPELKTDDAIADEVLAQYSGRRGAERLRQEMDVVLKSNSGITEKAAAVRAINNVRAALNSFWRSVARMLGLRYTSAEDVADCVLRDMLNLEKPGEMKPNWKMPQRESLDYKSSDDELGYSLWAIKSGINPAKKYLMDFGAPAKTCVSVYYLLL